MQNEGGCSEYIHEVYQEKAELIKALKDSSILLEVANERAKIQQIDWQISFNLEAIRKAGGDSTVTSEDVHSALSRGESH